MRNQVTAEGSFIWHLHWHRQTDTEEGFRTSLQLHVGWMLDFLPALGHGLADTCSVMTDGSCNSVPGWCNCRCYTSNPFLYLPKLFASVRCLHHLL